MAFAAPTQLLGPQIHSSAAAPRRRKYMPNDRTIVPTTIIVRACKKSLAAGPWTRKHIPYGRTIGPTTIIIRVCKKSIAPFSASVVSVAAAAAGGFILISSFPPSPPPIDGGGGGGGWFRGGGGDGGGGFWSNLFSPFVALAKEEGGGGQEWDPHGLPANIVVQLNKLSGLKRYKISEILFFDRRRSTTVAGTNDSFFEMVSLRNGGVYTKAQLQKEVENLASSGMFEKVDLEGKTKPDGTMAITVSFTESTWQSADAFRCINVGLLPQTKQMEMDADMTEREKLEYFRIQEREYKRRIDRSRPCLLPVTVQREVLQMLRERGKVSARLLQRIRDRVQKWYHDEGYACAQVVNFGNLNTREVVCEVVEGDITQLNIQFLDKLGNLCEGNTQLAVIRRELPRQLRSGHVFNIEAGKQALRNINSLSLFSNIEVNPRPDEKKEGGIIVEIKLREMDQKSAEVSIEWSLVPGRHGQPTLASIQPGGTISFEHRNIKGLNRSIVGSVTSSNLLNPQDDLSFKLDYVHPYLDGVTNPRNRTFRVSCFNSRKLSPVFTSGPGADEVPPVWIDRAGFKANVTENYTRQSKFTYGLVMEEITPRDETSSICTHGARALPSGGLSMDGPPTTLSGIGVDRMAFAQANVTRDNTKFLNGAIVGERDVFQVDQGLGIGSNFPFFNRHQLTLTRFIPLKQVEEGVDKSAPPVLVLHGHYGGCVGDLASYDAFTLGGPYSVRGYNMGELGACRNILELAAELRIPIKKTHVYLFAEHGNDLGSSKDVKGNPTEFFRRAGHGSSYGAGLKLGMVRAEYAVDHNTDTGAVFLRFGERF
ncbi:protein TOC75-3, chloroplastic-like [Musa acuminata AAA Group]|uniref:protein TOC75-3, chloroplastic-like n=1 Tax=Musa acuminata AAA Group TaxID=214697 RepID=UPI0031E3C863